MKLPILPQHQTVDSQALIRAIKQTAVAMGRVASEEQNLQGATVFTRPDCPDIRVANFAAEFDGTEAALDMLRQRKNCLVIDPIEATLDPSLKYEGYETVTKKVFSMRQYIEPDKIHRSLQIIPARAAYREVRELYQQMVSADLASVMVDRLDEPRLELFIGRLNHKPVALAGFFCQGQVGVLVPAYVIPEARKQSLGVTMLVHALEHCLRAQLPQVILDRTEGCSSIPLYQRVGFCEVGSYQKLYLSHPPSTANLQPEEK